MAACLGQVDLDIHLGDVLLEVDVVLDDAVDPGDGLADLLGLVPQDLEVGAADADDDGLAAAGQDLADALLEIGLDVATEPRVALDHLVDLVERLVVVDLGVDADPVLAEVDADHLVGGQGLADVGAEVADPGDGPQLLAGRGGDADLLGMGGAGRGHPVHQEVALLEVGEQRLAEGGQDAEAEQDHHQDQGQAPAGASG